MELIDGSTLAAALRQGSLSPERTAAIGATLAEALASVHDHAIVHRDVKPSNILMTADGEARLGDFGIARLLDASTLTVAGTTLGTAAYMAPEQLEDHQVGPGADIWSLGMVLLECLTGHRTYEGSPSEVVARRLAGPVPLPADLPVPWKLLLSGMLDHRPDQRLGGDEVAALLRTTPFRAPWACSRSPVTDRMAPTVPNDLTALAPGAGATAILGSGSVTGADDTRTSPPRVSGAQRNRRWRLAAIGRGRACGAVRRADSGSRVEPQSTTHSKRHRRDHFETAGNVDDLDDRYDDHDDDDDDASQRADGTCCAGARRRLWGISGFPRLGNRPVDLQPGGAGSRRRGGRKPESGRERSATSRHDDRQRRPERQDHPGRGGHAPKRPLGACHGDRPECCRRASTTQPAGPGTGPGVGHGHGHGNGKRLSRGSSLR